MGKHSTFTVGDLSIGDGVSPIVIAEMSGNHNGTLGRALRIVDAVAEAGCKALKLQTYTADTLTVDCDGPSFKIKGEHDLWGGRSLYDLYTEASTPWEWHQAIFERARDRGVVPFSTPFDPSSIEFLEQLGTQMYKTASAELVDLPLLREIASTGKPVIMSTGMATLSEIDNAVNAVRDAGCDDLVLLACTAAYPAAPSDARLANMAVLRDAFDVPVGLSDHTLGVGVAVAAAALGAVCIEKHVTLDRESGGVDEEFSLTPDELRRLVDETEMAKLASKTPASFGPTPDEDAVLRLRRSLYVVKDVRAGDAVDKSNVRSIRPTGGLLPEFFDLVEGRVFSADLRKGTPLTWDVL